MRANTLVMLLLAVVFGVAAVFLSNIWLNGQQPVAAITTTATHAEDMVVVAAVPLKFGDRLTPDNTREIPWTAGALPVGGFKSKADLLTDKDGDRQVLSPMAANEPILDWKVTGPGQRATLSAVLGEGMKAVSIRVNDVLGVAGFVLPGDRVDVLLSRIDRDSNAFVDVLLQDIKVLAIDQKTADQEQNPSVAKAVTLEVSTVDAQKLTLAANVGTLSLALREAANKGAEFTQRVTLGDLTAGQPPIEQAEETAAIPAPEAAPAKPNRVQVIVVRGTEEQVYEVPVAR
jgi:pilus assembly protein CpaB